LHEAASIFVLDAPSISPGFNDFIRRGAVRASARAVHGTNKSFNVRNSGA